MVPLTAFVRFVTTGTTILESTFETLLIAQFSFDSVSIQFNVTYCLVEGSTKTIGDEFTSEEFQKNVLKLMLVGLSLSPTHYCIQAISLLPLAFSLVLTRSHSHFLSCTHSNIHTQTLAHRLTIPVTRIVELV